MGTTEVKSAEHLDEYAKDKGKVLLDFYSPFCGRCTEIWPYFEKQCKDKDITFLKVNVLEQQDVADKYKIEEMPTFIVVDSEAKPTFFIANGSEDAVNQAISEYQKL